jgi:hypothetical protein
LSLRFVSSIPLPAPPTAECGVNAYLFGLALLLYSYTPTGFPMAVCAKVVERDIYGRKSAFVPIATNERTQG